MKRIEIVEAFKRSYRSVSEEHSHCPYQNILHDLEEDTLVPWRDLLYDAMRQVPEGNIVRIVIEDTGERCDYADDWWCLLRPHEYGPRSALLTAKEQE